MKKRALTSKTDENRNKPTDASLSWTITIIFILLFFLSPLAPDEKITRYKLWTIETGLACLLVLWSIKNIFSDRFKIKKSPLNPPIILYFFLTISFYAMSKEKPVAESELTRMFVCLFGFFLVANNFDDKRRKSLVLLSLMFSSFLVFLYGILQYYGGIGSIMVPRHDRPMSTFGNPIFFAVYIICVLPLFFGLLLETTNPHKKIFIMILIPSGLFALYLTATRAAWIGFCLSSGVFYILSEKINNWKIAKFFWKNRIPVMLILVIVLVFYYGLISFSEKYASKIKTAHIKIIEIIHRPQGHLLIWRDSLKMWKANPIFGSGTGAFHINFPKYASEELKKRWPQNQFIVNDAHSEFVQLLSETGIAGFGIFIWFISAFFIYGIKMLKQSETYRGENYYFKIGLLSGGAAILTQNIFSVDMRFIISSFYFYVLCGFIASNSTDEYKINIPSFLKIPLVILIIFTSYSLLYQGFIKQYKAHISEKKAVDFFDQPVIDPQKAKNELAELIKKYPDNARLYFKMGFIYAKEMKTNKESLDKAIYYFEKAVSVDPTVEKGGAYNNLGNIYFTIGQRDKAIYSYKKSLEVNPGQKDAHLNLGIVYYYQGMLKEASDELNNVLQLNPSEEEKARVIILLKKMRE